MPNRGSALSSFATAAAGLWPRMWRLWDRSSGGAQRSLAGDSCLLLDLSPDTVARYDRSGRGIYANATLLRTWSVLRSQFLGRTPLDVPGGDAGALLQARVEEALATGREDEFEYRQENAEGALTWTHVRLVPERQRDGTVTGVLAIGRDISLLKEATEMLEESRERLRRLAAWRDSEQERERKQLAYRMHEDLAQVLAVLGWELKGIGQELAESDPRRSRVEYMAALSDRALNSVLSTVDDIRPPTLGLGVVPALKRLTNRFQESSGVPCILRISGGEPVVHEERATMIYRMAEALLGTIAERPGTERVELALSQVGANYVLRTHDWNPSLAPEGDGESIGLIVVQEFALRLGGEVVVVEEAGGRLVEVMIPADAVQGERSNAEVNLSAAGTTTMREGMI